MDRNALTGLVLITILMLVYFQFFAPKPPEQETTSPEPSAEIIEESPVEEEDVPLQTLIQEDSVQREAYED